jgi:hypothetical protein
MQRPTRLSVLLESFADQAGGSLRRNWYWPLIVFVLIATLNITLTIALDNTNVGTTNGLWKTPNVYKWEHHTGKPTDDGGCSTSRSMDFYAV